MGKCDLFDITKFDRMYTSFSSMSRSNFYTILLHENESHSRQLSWESVFHLSICSLNVLSKRRLHAG